MCGYYCRKYKNGTAFLVMPFWETGTFPSCSDPLKAGQIRYPVNKSGRTALFRTASRKTASKGRQHLCQAVFH